MNINLRLLLSTATLVLLSTSQYVTGQHLTWANQIGGSNSDFINTLTVDSQGASIIGGRFLGTVPFGEGSAYEATVTAANIDGYIAKYRRGGQFQWVQQIIAAEQYSADVESVTTDVHGNVYVAGEYTGDIILGAGQSGEVTLQDVSDCEGFVAKYKHNGELLWAVSIRGFAEIIPFSISVDNSGNVVVSGLATGTFTLGEGEANEITFTNFGGFLASFDSASGHLNWAAVQASGDLGDSSGQGIGTDEQGNIYLTGYFSGEVTFGQDQANETILIDDNPELATTDAFLAKYDVTGAFQWVKQIQGNEGESGEGIHVDRHGTVHLTGFFVDEIVFEQGASSEKRFKSRGITDSFTAKFNRHGVLQWADHVASDNNANHRKVAVDRHGNSLVVGTFIENMILSPGTPDEQIINAEAPFERGLYGILYSRDGAILDTRVVSSNPQFDISAAFDKKGNQLMAGSFAGDLIIKEDGEVVETLTSAGGIDGFLMQYREGQSRRSALSAISFALDAPIVETTLASKDLPKQFQLSQNYPNPFNPTTTIQYALPESVGEVRLEIYDLLGNLVHSLESGAKEAGFHEAVWNGRDTNGRLVASGSYIYRLQAGPLQFSKTMVLLK